MKILQLLPHPPYPPNSGGRIRQWLQIRYLASRHDVTTICYAFTDEEHEEISMRKDICSRLIVIKHPGINQRNLFHGIQLPSALKAYDTHVMRATLAERHAETFDCVIIENLFMSCFVDLLPFPAVLQEYNIESQICRQYAELPQRKPEEKAFWRAAWIKLREYENQIWPKFPLRTVVSAPDKQEMESRCRLGKTVLIENGVDVEEVSCIHPSSNKRFLVMGSLDYFPNSDGVFYLVKCVMPLVWEKDPEISLCIAGRNPHKAILDLSRHLSIDVVPNPEDMRKLALSCCASIVPLRMGGGTRIKILEALAWGLPTISTSIGCRGLVVTDDQHVLIRDGIRELADGILDLANDSPRRARLRNEGRKLVEERYDCQRIFPVLEQEIEILIDMDRHPAVNL